MKRTGRPPRCAFAPSVVPLAVAVSFAAFASGPTTAARLESASLAATPARAETGASVASAGMDVVAPPFDLPRERDYELSSLAEGLMRTGTEFVDGTLWTLTTAKSSPYGAVATRVDAATGKPGDDLALKTASGYDFFPTDLACESSRVDVLSWNRIYRFDRTTLAYEGRLTPYLDGPSPTRMDDMLGLAIVGTTAFVSVYDDRSLYRFELPPNDGDATVVAKAFATLPERAIPRGMTTMGGRLYVADSFHDVVYEIDPADGSIDGELVTYERDSRGLASNGRCLYMRNWSDGKAAPLFFQKLGPYMTRSEPLDVTVTFRAFATNTGSRVASVRVVAALPGSDARQDVVALRHPGAADVGTDRYGQRYVTLSSGPLAPGASATLEWSVDARVWAFKYRIPSEAVVDPSASPPDVKRLYLSSSFAYLAMDSPVTRNFAASVTAAPPARLTDFARAVRDSVFASLSYDLDSTWDDAATVIARGSGSCSEYSFVTAATFRLRGYPVRFVGATTGGRALDEGVADTVYHRWIEIYAPGFGWVPMDCNHNDDDDLDAWSNELVFGVDARKLTVLKGGCEDEAWLGRGYAWKRVVETGSASVEAGYWWSRR